MYQHRCYFGVTIQYYLELTFASPKVVPNIMDLTYIRIDPFGL